MVKHVRHILILLIIVVVGSTAINISSSIDYNSGRVKVDTGLPVVAIYTSLDSSGDRIEVSRNQWTVASIDVIDGSNNDYDGFSFSGKVQIKGRGHSSWRLPKKGYSLKFEDDVELLGLNEGEDFALVANYPDKTLMRNSIAYDFTRKVLSDREWLHFTPSYRFVELYLNDRFLGNYILVEKIEVDKNRLNLNKLNKDNNLNDNITGGYLLEIDMRTRVNESNNKFFATEYINEDNVLYIYEEGELLPTTISVRYPKPRNITDEQFEYIKNYVLEAEKALFSENFTDPEEGYSKYFNVESFVDWYIINELFKSIDAPMLTSVYMFKDVDSKLTMGPVWDYDLSMGVSGMRLGYLTEGFFVGKSEWFKRLLSDPAFVEMVIERWIDIKDKHIEGLFEDVDNKYNYLYRSQKENFRRWNIIGRWVWPEPNDIQPRKSYNEEISYLKDWLNKRVEWFDRTFNPEKDILELVEDIKKETHNAGVVDIFEDSMEEDIEDNFEENLDNSLEESR